MLAPYPNYTPSGLPWAPQIPEGWQVQRNGRLFSHRVETGYPDLPILEVSLRTGVRVRDMVNGKRKQVMSAKEKYKRAVKGDIAYNMMRMWQGAVGPAPTDGLVSPAYVVVRPHADVNTAYFSYLFRTAAYMQEVNKFSRGIVADRNRLYWESFKQMPSLVPPTLDQDQIVLYLRAQDARVVRLIRAKRSLIGLLEEQRLRVVDQFISRGADASACLRYSGVDAIGDVPECWQVKRLKWVCRLNYGDALAETTRRPGRVNVYGSNGIVGTHDMANALGPCLVVGRKGSFGKVNYSQEDLFAIDTAYYIDRKSTKADIRWLYYLLLWCRLDRISKDSAVPGLDRNDAHNTYVPVPSYEEQKQIAARLDSETAEIDASIAEIEREIRLINEYRDRVIADVVTGRIDVQNWRPNPDEIITEEDLAALGDADDNNTAAEESDGDDGHD